MIKRMQEQFYGSDYPLLHIPHRSDNIHSTGDTGCNYSTEQT